MLTLKPELTLPAVGLTGFETPLSEEEGAVQASVHQFAKNVLRSKGDARQIGFAGRAGAQRHRQHGRDLG